jgi:signal transduction histidine kinase
MQHANQEPVSGRVTRLTLKTLWPQAVTGMLFAGTLVWATLNPHPAATLLAVGACLIFALTLAYIYTVQTGRFTLTSLLMWIGGLSLAVISALALPSFLSISGLFVFSAVSYGVGESGRRTMLVGTIAAVVTLAVCFGISLMSEAGLLSLGVSRPPMIALAGIFIVSLLLTIDNMRRLWRHYNRTAAVYRDLRVTNQALLVTQANLQRHVQAQAELLEVSRVIRSTQALEPLLDEILVQMKRVVDFDLASVLVLREGNIVAVRRAGDAAPNESTLAAALMATPQWRRMIEQKQPVVVDDVYQQPDFLLPFDQMLGPDKPAEATPQHCWMGLPLVVRGGVVGAISLSHHTPALFTPDRVEIAFAFANHAAVAIESSRTREEAVSAATLAERTRLARELHDSVSQALYGMVLTTRTSLELIDRDPAKARDTMRYTIDLADAALSEMRALIFELRPESLQEEGLLAALRKQTAALTLRNKLDLQLDLCAEEPALPIETKEALYRITLEAIQNTVRHAGARTLRIAMQCDDNVLVSIADDGKGFDVQGEYPGHLGLQTMRERAQAMGGQVTIESRPNEGTHVRIIIPVRPPPPTTVSAAV